MELTESLLDAFKSNFFLPDEKKIQVLGEVIGITHREGAYPKHFKCDGLKKAVRSLNVFCEVFWNNELIHKTKTVYSDNDPIWACDTGSLFTINIQPYINVPIDSELRIHVYHQDNVRKKSILVGVSVIPGMKISSGEWCNEQRLEFDIYEDDHTPIISDSNRSLYDSFMNSFNRSDRQDIRDEIEDTGERLQTIDDNSADSRIKVKQGTLALRFRVATDNDIGFLQTVEEIDNDLSKKKTDPYRIHEALMSMNHIMTGKTLANFVTEKSTSYAAALSLGCLEENFIFKYYGTMIDENGQLRIRVKPGPDPNRPKEETTYLSGSEIEDFAFKPSKNWTQAGSGSLGQVYLEVICCEGLKNKDMGRIFGNKTDAFVCVIFEDCLVQTDVIEDCLSPYWMPWTQRAFILNRMYPPSAIHLGVFDHDYGWVQHKFCGKTTIDLQNLIPDTVYTLKYNLYSSTVVSNRQPKGTITVRLRLEDFNPKKTLLAAAKLAPILHVNVMRKKTLSVARATCHGKYREDVFNMKILKSYIDEITGYIEAALYDLHDAAESLLFWRGQFKVGKYLIPLHSAIFFCSSVLVVERPHFLPSYVFLGVGWFLLVKMDNKSQHPLPWKRGKSFHNHLSDLIGLGNTNIHRSFKKKGVRILPGEGVEQEEAWMKEWKERIERDKTLQTEISKFRQEMQEIMNALTNFSIHTPERVGGLNPLNKLLPLQLLLKNILHYIRLVKSIIVGDESSLSFWCVGCFFTLGIIFLIIPWQYILYNAIRITVWVVLGPWMRIIDLMYQNRDKEEMKKVMDELRERQERQLRNARVQREEAVKLMATRILRFGRFAVKVPSLHVTRYHDYPLPESTAVPIGDDDDNSSHSGPVEVKNVVPGQKHTGVMIPTLLSDDESIPVSVKKRVNTKKKKIQSQEKLILSMLDNAKRNRQSNRATCIQTQRTSNAVKDSNYHVLRNIGQEDMLESSHPHIMIQEEKVQYHPKLEQAISDLTFSVDSSDDSI